MAHACLPVSIGMNSHDRFLVSTAIILTLARIANTCLQATNSSDIVVFVVIPIRIGIDAEMPDGPLQRVHLKIGQGRAQAFVNGL